MEEYDVFEDDTQETTEQPPLTYDDIYNAMYNAVLDADAELKIQDAEQNVLLNEEDATEENTIFEEEITTEHTYQVEVTNFPLNQEVTCTNYSPINLASLTDAILQDSVEFASGTDAQLYTVATSGNVDTVDSQSVALMLEIRNILLLFMLIWFITYIIRFIKNTVITFTKGRNNNE